MARNIRKTIEALKRLAERPGTLHEGETARRMLEKMVGSVPTVKPFRIEDFPRGTSVFYNYWAYPQNAPCVVVGKFPRVIKGETWLRLRFEHLKQPRWVPVTSAKGSHISKVALSAEEAGYLYKSWLW